MKQFILMIILLISGMSLSTGAYAQGAKMTPEQRIHNRVETLKSQVGLSDDQVSKIENIYLDAQQKVATLQNSNPDLQTFKTQRQQINRDAQAQVKAILSPDQLQKLRSIRKAEKQQRMNNQPGSAPGN